MHCHTRDRANFVPAVSLCRKLRAILQYVSGDVTMTYLGKSKSEFHSSHLTSENQAILIKVCLTKKLGRISYCSPMINCCNVSFYYHPASPLLLSPQLGI